MNHLGFYLFYKTVGALKRKMITLSQEQLKALTVSNRFIYKSISRHQIAGFLNLFVYRLIFKKWGCRTKYEPLLFSAKNNCQTSKESGSWCKINV